MIASRWVALLFGAKKPVLEPIHEADDVESEIVEDENVQEETLIKAPKPQHVTGIWSLLNLRRQVRSRDLLPNPLSIEAKEVVVVEEDVELDEEAANHPPAERTEEAVSSPIKFESSPYLESLPA